LQRSGVPLHDAPRRRARRCCGSWIAGLVYGLLPGAGPASPAPPSA
jgi:hypothetical protein